MFGAGVDVPIGGLCRRTASDNAAVSRSRAGRNISGGWDLRWPGKSAAHARYAAESTKNNTTNLKDGARIPDGLRIMPLQ